MTALVPILAVMLALPPLSPAPSPVLREPDDPPPLDHSVSPQPSPSTSPAPGRSLAIRVEHRHSGGDTSFLYNALHQRARQLGYCVASSAELVVRVQLAPAAVLVQIYTGTQEQSFIVSDVGEVAQLEAVHRTFAALDAWPDHAPIDQRCDEIPISHHEEAVATDVHRPSPSAHSLRPQPLRLHALAAIGAAVRHGGVDATSCAQLGLTWRSSWTIALDVAPLFAVLDSTLWAIDTDVGAFFGWQRRLTHRAGVRVGTVAGVRQHTYVLGDRHRTGTTTWMAGLDVGVGWLVGRHLVLEVSMQPRMAGHGWVHDVGIERIGQRGRTSAALVVGLGFGGSAT